MQTRAEFLEARRSGIGASDVAPILGLSPYKTAIDVYLDKVGPVGQVAEMAPQLEWGQRLEPVIASAIIDRYGWSLSRPATVRHAAIPCLIASPDRVNADGELIEIKTARFGDGWGEPDTADIPEHYWLQVQHQLEVIPHAQVCWVFVLIGGNDFRRYRVERDPGYLETVAEPLGEFWDLVMNRTPPEPDWTHSRTLEAVKKLYPVQAGTTVELQGEEIEYTARAFAHWGGEAKQLEVMREQAKAKLIAAMGTAEKATLPNGTTIHRKTVNRAGYTVKPSTYETFTIKEPK